MAYNQLPTTEYITSLTEGTAEASCAQLQLNRIKIRNIQFEVPVLEIAKIQS